MIPLKYTTNFRSYMHRILSYIHVYVWNTFIECDGGWLKSLGVINEEGTQIHLWGFTNEMEIWNWQSDEDVQKIKEEREPADAPTCAYAKIQPDKPGKLIWLSGTGLYLLNHIMN